MFRADVKQISRKDLALSSSPSTSGSRAPSPDVEQEEVVKRRLAELLGGIGANSETRTEQKDGEDVIVTSAVAQAQENDSEEGLYAFKLFAGPTSSHATTESTTGAHAHTSAELSSTLPPTQAEVTTTAQGAESTQEAIQYIRLATPELSSNYAEIDIDTQRARHRPLSYYIIPATSEEKMMEYKDAALEGSYVLDVLSKTKWTGCGYEWRVTKLTASPSIQSATNDAAQNATGAMPMIYDTQSTSLPLRKRTRIGKKSRIILRKRLAAERERMIRKQKEAAQRKEQEKEKEEHLKEKKRQLNRKKQLKKREKKRAAVGAEGGEGDEDELSLQGREEGE